MTDSKRILIVDDNFEVALFLRSTVEVIWPDYQVVNVPSAEAGMLEVHRSGVDLVITDLLLPGIDGVEFIDQIHGAAPDTPIIVITGEPSPKLHEQARSRKLAGFFLNCLRAGLLPGRPFGADKSTKPSGEHRWQASDLGGRRLCYAYAAAGVR